MSNFLDSIKITDEEKKKFMSKIIFTMIHSTKILSLDELLEEADNIKEKLSENEILATYSLAREIKKIVISSSDRNKEILEHLEVRSFSINEDKLFEFVNRSVKDIEDTKRRTPNLKWRLQIGKILKRLEGIDPYTEELDKYEKEQAIKKR
ncbi:MAG: hypothetical protein IJE59_04150 [Clostridia bacterium]|nr:hypothetical protein [Clostridia bacterium]